MSTSDHEKCDFVGIGTIYVHWWRTCPCHERPHGWAKRAFAPPWKLALRRNIFWKTWNQQFNSD